MDDHIRRLNTKIRKKKSELNALFTKILVAKKLETAEMSLTGVLKVIGTFSTDGFQDGYGNRK